jgi:putative inorganic carbon (hco3(-)) transporter
MAKSLYISMASVKPTVEQKSNSKLAASTRIWFIVTLLYLILDYSRIYTLAHLGSLRPMMIITLVLASFIVIGGKYYYLAKSRQTTLLWLFLALLAAYVPFARNNFYAFNTFKTQLLYMPFILSVIICVNSFARLKNVIFICVFLQIYIAFWALTHGGVGPGNYFADENDLALYVNMWLPFCYFLFFEERRLSIKFIYLIGSLIGLLSIIVSFSRGGFIGLLAVGGTIFLLSKKKILTGVFLSLFAAFIVFYASNQYWAEISTSTNIESGTAKGRIEAWKSGWRMFLDNPLGVGGGNFMVRFPEYQTDYFKRGMWGRVSHSLWFTLIPELGIFGIFIYLSLLYHNLRDIFFLKSMQFGESDGEKKYMNYLGKSFIASFAGYFVSGIFLSVLYYAHYWYLTGIVVAAGHIGKNLYGNGASSNNLPQ